MNYRQPVLACQGSAKKFAEREGVRAGFPHESMKQAPRKPEPAAAADTHSSRRTCHATFEETNSYGIELIHPMREGRSEQQIGKKG
jgi:hypothetical protein